MKLNTEKINKYLHSNKYDFKTFSMNYTKPIKKIINRLDLSVDDTFSHFGPIKDIKNLNQFLCHIGTNTQEDINKIEKLIIDIIRKVLKAYHKKYFWLDIRVTQANNNFNIPRWHKDGNFFLNGKPPEPNTSKFATVLKGPGTLLIKGTLKNNKIYTDHLSNHLNIISKKYRSILAEKLADEKVVQVKNTQGVIFFTGGTLPMEKAALHSEPPFDKPRLFISILPSTESNIKGLKKRWLQ